MSSTIALCCHCVSHGAIFNPSLPVIGPDGCKAALLQNMSRAGEEEVGVESGKGQRPKNALHVLFSPHAVTSKSCCSNIKTHQDATKENEQIFSEMYLSIFKVRVGRGWLLARGHAAEVSDVI